VIPTAPPTPLTLRAGRSLENFLRRVEPLTIAERRILVEQALIVLDGFYVHLRLKRAMHAVDPMQRLRLLRYRLDAMPDAEFHSELISIFTSLRDLHTLYQLPEPARGSVAALGFLIERYYPTAAGAPRFVISKMHPQLRSQSFQPGVELVSWNGIPIVRAIERNAERASGSNPDARIARGLESLALRPLRTTLPPDEHFVIVGYKTPRGATREVRVAWRVLSAVAARRGHDAVATIQTHHGIDASAESVRHVKAALFAASGAASSTPQNLLRAEALPARRGPVGYLRIYSFNTASARTFLDQAEQLLQPLPKRGLIVDIRANPGGSIPAAEGLLQLLTSQRVEPSRFSLTPTAATAALCAANPAFSAWAGSIDSSVETGEVFSQAFPLSDPSALAEARQPFGGRLVLITDALSYSAADIFAAGFQDNNLGSVLGTDPHTGAGGANVWTHDLLRLWLPDDLQPLPAGASFRIALRRVTRANARIGVPLEDLGVQPDHTRRPTYRDITEHNQDLLTAATRLIDRPTAATV
jgi:hypothetical protein